MTKLYCQVAIIVSQEKKDTASSHPNESLACA